MALFLSALIVATFCSSALCSPQEIASAAPEWLRGSGDELELRLTGEVTRRDGQPVTGAKVRIQISFGNRVFATLEPPVDGQQFEAWLPVNRHPWHAISLTATCPDGARCTTVLLRHHIRERAIHGLPLELVMPSRTVVVRVKHDDDVAQAQIRARLSSGATLRTEANADGTAELKLIDNEALAALTAWCDRRLIGGYQFGRKPVRDPKADTHVISLYRCRPFEVRFKDTDGRPLAGVEPTVHVATPLPDINYFGQPDDVQLVTDQEGIAVVDWSPDFEDPHCDVEVPSDQWVIESSQFGDDGLDVILSRVAAPRTIIGHIRSQTEFAGGFHVKLQGSQRPQAHLVSCFSDADGRFSAEINAEATYAALLEDEKWIAEPVEDIRFDDATGTSPPLEFVPTAGIPVRLRLTQGSDRQPVHGARVRMNASHYFSRPEDRGSRSYLISRSIYASSTESGVVDAVAPAGMLRASIYYDDWREEHTIDVQPGQDNVLHVHRTLRDAMKVRGRILAESGDPQLVAGATLHIRAIDGATNEEFRLRSGQDGRFRLSTKATTLAAIAYSADGTLIGTTIIRDVAQPVVIQLHPAKSYAGQITKDGRPLADRQVRASMSIADGPPRQSAYATAFHLPRISALTDSEGRFQLDGLPAELPIHIRMESLNPDSENVVAIDDVYFHPGDTQRRRVSRLGASSHRPDSPTLAERFAGISRDCRLGDFHLMVIVHDQSQPLQREFIERTLRNYHDHAGVTGYMPLQLDIAALAASDNQTLVTQKNWPQANQTIFACVYDTTGRELGRIQIDPASKDAADVAAAFVDQHAPAPQDASVKWKKAFERAQEENKRVWVRTGSFICRPCTLLSRWVDDHRQTLEQDFVLLKIDVVRDRHGQDIEKQLAQGRFIGTPFHAMFDAEQRLLTDSFGPLGNIGAVAGFEGKRHFQAMLEAACQRMSPGEIQTLLDSLPGD